MSDQTESTRSGTWIIVPQYDMASRVPNCSLTGTIKRPGDIGVFRPALPIGWINLEGSFDVSQLAIEEAARILGWSSPEEVADEHAKLTEQLVSSRGAYARECRKTKRLQATIDELQGTDA